VWIGIVNLAIQYWELYYLVNEQNKSVAELWDGECLRCTFHRCVDRRLLLMSEELVNLVSTVELSEEHDAMAWQYQSTRVYSSQSLYAIINFRGVKPIYLPVVWKLIVPHRIHFFLWLVSKNKLLTRDDLERQNLDDYTCLFCTEKEYVHHLFFKCVIARKVWEEMSQMMGV
jgi:hypothetical protein